MLGGRGKGTRCPRKRGHCGTHKLNVWSIRERFVDLILDSGGWSKDELRCLHDAAQSAMQPITQRERDQALDDQDRATWQRKR